MKRSMALRLRILLGILWIFLAGIWMVDEADAKLQVVTTTTMITDMVKEVGGEDVNVVGLMGPGVDPHLYKPAATDVTKLLKANVIFYNGLHLEGKMGDIFSQMANRGIAVYAVTASVPEEWLLRPEGFEGAYDPHVWFDPLIWSRCVDTVVT